MLGDEQSQKLQNSVQKSDKLIYVTATELKFGIIFSKFWKLASNYITFYLSMLEFIMKAFKMESR